MTRVKVCGITREADLRAVAAAGADAAGFVTDIPVDSPREVAVERAATLVAAAPPFLTTTLVVIPDSPTHAVDLVERAAPDAVQVHGEFDPADLRRVREATDRKLVAAVDHAAPERARALADAADALLVDSTREAGAGGTGEPHDWAGTRELARSVDVPVVLAGGLTPGNVADAVRTVEPYAVDVASGVEAEGGVKDHDAVDRFVREARAGEVAA